MKKIIFMGIVFLLAMTQIQAKIVLIPYEGLMIAVKVKDPSGEPKADAGKDMTVHVGETVTINGKGTDDNGIIVSYEWKKGSTVLSNTATLVYSPTQEGKETLTLTVTDDDGLSNSDSMVLTAVINMPPVANAGLDQSVQVNQSITITGTGTDSDGSIVSYEWKKGNTVLANTASFSYTPIAVGTDTLTLVVTDDDGATATDSMKVTVTAAPNEPPVANAGEDKTTRVNTAVTIKGTASDSDGSISSVKWTKNGTVLSTLLQFNYTPTTAGKDTLTLSVTDNDGATVSDSMQVTVTVAPANQPPVATANKDVPMLVNETTTLMGVGKDTDGRIVSYKWTIGNTLLANTAIFEYSPSSVGKHTLTFTVTDDRGASSSDTTVVNVSPVDYMRTYVEKYSILSDEELIIHMPFFPELDKLKQLYIEDTLSIGNITKIDLQNIDLKCDGNKYAYCHATVKVDLDTLKLNPSIYKLNLISTNNASPDVYLNVRAKASLNEKIVVIQPILTWHAYNKIGGRDLYTSPYLGGKYSSRVSRLRALPTPVSGHGNYHAASSAREYARFFKKNNIKVSLYDDFDLHEQNDIFKSVKLVILIGHPEYWTYEMREKLEEFVRNGGNLLVSGGNTLWWKVRLEGNDIVVNKNRIDRDYLYNDIDKSGLWREKPVSNPEESFLGLTYRAAGFSVKDRIPKYDPSFLTKYNFTQKDYDNSSGMLVIDQSHPIFKNTSLQQNDVFGKDINLIDYETDGLPIKDDFSIDFSGFPSANKNIVPLAYSWVTNEWNGLGPILKVVLIAESRYGSGKVLHMGSTGWLNIIQYPKSISAKVLLNAIDYMSK